MHAGLHARSAWASCSSSISTRGVERRRGRRARWLTGLYVQPHEGRRTSSRSATTGCRRAKVPMLVLNATTLNTGHNWQFTASWMGEPPPASTTTSTATTSCAGCTTARRRRRTRTLRLGHAVAASACVPGPFNPVVLSGLYGARPGHAGRADGPPRRRRRARQPGDGEPARAGLLGDARLRRDRPDGDAARSERRLLSVPLRSSSILMARVRGAQYAELAARRSSSSCGASRSSI